MNKYFLYMMALVLVISSCNKDEVISTSVDEFYRAKTAVSSPYFTQVFEYTPAPGQFINETKTGGFDGTQSTPEAAIEYAYQRMKDDLFVSLGGFGGYIIVGFDHSLDNTVGYDLAVKGNSFKGSSEPGVVWVMQDENGNGLPDDTWYELKGCETGLDCTIQNYEVTYYRPSEPKQPVKWTDNKGNSGEIDYLKQFHNQDYYYPLWIKEDRYTLKGTCVEARNYDQSGKGTYWVNPEYDWGYVDNFSSEDLVKDGSEELKDCNLFDFSNAIDSNGASRQLDFVDFVKVQVAINAKSGWLGEVSTEVFNFIDPSFF